MCKTIRLPLLWFFLQSISLCLLGLPQSQKIPEAPPEIQAMEREIWELLNEERAFDNLPLLELSPALSDLARKHSLDMANRGDLTHRSSDRKTLARRLQAAGIHYIKAGENIARSETFVAEFIHENLIESPEHRANILDPDFQQVGIGIVYKKDEGYYVTQDFLRPIVPRTDRDVKSIIQHNINNRRQAQSLPPLVFLEHRENFANNLSKLKAKGSDLPVIPETYGETLVIFLTTPSLSDEGVVFKDALNPRFDRAALGVWFAKNREYPGGAYFLTLMLFARNRYESLSQFERKDVVLAQVNTLRKKKGLKSLKLDEGLTRIAEEMAPKILGLKGSAAHILPEYRRYEILTYGTKDLNLLPGLFESRVNNSRLRRIGIGILFSKDKKFPDGAYWVALIFE